MDHLEIVGHAESDELQVRVVDKSGELVSVSHWYPTVEEAHAAVVQMGRAINVWLANKGAEMGCDGEFVIDVDEQMGVAL